MTQPEANSTRYTKWVNLCISNEDHNCLNPYKEVDIPRDFKIYFNNFTFNESSNAYMIITYPQIILMNSNDTRNSSYYTHSPIA